MTDRRRLIGLGVLGTIGSAGGVAADLLSGFSTEGAEVITSPFSVLSLANLESILVGKPYWQFVAGNHVALAFIPLGIFGVLHVAPLLEPAGRTAQRLWIGLGVAAYVVGTGFHLMYGFLGIAMKTGAEASAGGEVVEEVVARYGSLFQPVAVALILLMSVVLLGLTTLIVMGRTVYPRGFVVLTPLVVQLVTGLTATVAPAAVKVALIVTAYNASFAVFFAASTVFALRYGSAERDA